MELLFLVAIREKSGNDRQYYAKTDVHIALLTGAFPSYILILLLLLRLQWSTSFNPFTRAEDCV